MIPNKMAQPIKMTIIILIFSVLVYLMKPCHFHLFWLILYSSTIKVNFEQEIYEIFHL